MGEMLKHQQHLLLDSIPAAFIVTDSHSKVIYANQQSESFFGYKTEEVEGQRIGILFLEEDLVYFLPNILFLTLYKNGFRGEALLKQKNGKKIFVHLTTASFHEGGETFINFSFLEIQRLKSLERERAEAEHWASVGRMVKGIAHQFRDPLHSIEGYANRLRKKSANLRTGQSYVSRIALEIKKLENILGRVEEYAQVSRPVFAREPVPDILKAAVDGLSGQIEKQGARVELQISATAGDAHAFVHVPSLAKAFTHLLQNSLEAVRMNPPGEQKKPIRVILSDDGEKIKLKIWDRGRGIPKRDLPRIFDPFFSTVPDRAGLGLTYARRVLEEHGGTISVESRLGKGTVCTVEIPKDRRRKIRRELIAAIGQSGTGIESPAPAFS